MKIAIGSDHKGRELKEYILDNIKNVEFIDCSKENFETDDYPDYGILTAETAVKENILGIVICGTGIGISIAANKVNGARCALVHEIDDAILAREHNNANIIALSSKVNKDDAIKYVNAFINTSFSNGERHIRRINKISLYEVNNGR